jgi:mannosylglucosylglycerate synthase
MPSHQEGFGMPILEAGLEGLPVFTSEIPASREIAGSDVRYVDPKGDPQEIAGRIIAWARDDPVQRLRCRVRQEYTWQAIFDRQIEPLLRKNTST